MAEVAEHALVSLIFAFWGAHEPSCAIISISNCIFSGIARFLPHPVSLYRKKSSKWKEKLAPTLLFPLFLHGIWGKTRKFAIEKTYTNEQLYENSRYHHHKCP